MKYYDSMIDAEKDGSPPSRAAWIEIEQFEIIYWATTVAAFTGGVD